MIKRFFTSDPSYKEMVSKYTKWDGMLAVFVYMLLFAVYYLMGVLYVKRQIYIGVPVNALLIALCAALVLARRQKIDTIGFTAKNLGRALLAGAVFGFILGFLMNMLPNLLAGGKLIPFGEACYNVFYYFIVIALTEEVVFRGYIQTRIYGLIKNDTVAVIVTGFMFYAMHLPFQMPVNGMQINLVNMLIMVVLHVLMNFLYRKYNSLAAPTVFHGLLDFFGNLLR